MRHICCVGPSVLSSKILITQALRPGLYNCRAFGPGFRMPQGIFQSAKILLQLSLNVLLSLKSLVSFKSLSFCPFCPSRIALFPLNKILNKSVTTHYSQGVAQSSHRGYTVTRILKRDIDLPLNCPILLTWEKVSALRIMDVGYSARPDLNGFRFTYRHLGDLYEVTKRLRNNNSC